MNAVVLAVGLMLVLSLCRVHVVLALIIGAVVGGLFGGLGLEGTLKAFNGGLGGGAQFRDQAMLFRGVVAEQLFLGLLQGHPRHARFDLQPFQPFAAATGLLARPGPLDRRLHRVDRRGGGGFLALGLGGARQRGLLRALGAFCGPALLVAAQASLALLETLAGLFGLQQLLPLLADFRLGRAVVLLSLIHI